MNPAIFVGGFIIALALLRVALAAGDFARIRSYVASQGGRLVSARWTPFGPGWFGDRKDRIYKVRYSDRNGSERTAYCKTSMMSGVYFTQDRVTSPPQNAGGSSELDRIKEENVRLRQELERLKNRTQ